MMRTREQQIAEGVAHVQAVIAAACARVNRDPSEVTLVAVSKTHPAADILAAVAAGVRHFGENRVEEAAIKCPEVNKHLDIPVVWHMIGHIQSRKARDVPSLFQVVHSIDSLNLAEKLSRSLAESGQILDVLVQINVSGEDSKSGLEAVNWEHHATVRQTVKETIQQIATLSGLNVRGLMTMAPIVDDAEQVRPVFASLARLRTTLSEDLQLSLPDLSMGMTDDYPVAIEEGATLIRVGRAIFGARN